MNRYDYPPKNRPKYVPPSPEEWERMREARIAEYVTVEGIIIPQSAFNRTKINFRREQIAALLEMETTTWKNNTESRENAVSRLTAR